MVPTCIGKCVYCNIVRKLALNSPRIVTHHMCVSLYCPLFREMVECFQRLSEDSACRVVVLTGEGQSFTSGIYVGECCVDHCLQVK